MNGTRLLLWLCYVCIFVLFLTRNSLMLLIKASYKHVHMYSYSYYNKSGFILDSQGK